VTDTELCRVCITRPAIIDDLAKNPNSSTPDVRRRIGKPRATVDRQLQALHMLGVAEVDEYEYGGKTRWLYSLSKDISPQVIDPQSFPDLSVHTPNPLATLCR
jgi:predicted transcriptional regulator